jgi:hypothetical protein
VIERQSQSHNAVIEATYDEFLTWCLEIEEHNQKTMQENTEFAEEIEQLKMQLKKQAVEIGQLSKTVNDMDQVSFIIQFSCTFFLPPLLSYIMVNDSTHSQYSRAPNLNLNWEVGSPDSDFM